MSHPSWIEIDLAQLKKNVEIVRRHVKALLCVPVKANAYGHGLCPVAKTLEAAGVDYVAVAHLSEGVQLRKAGIKLPILVLGAIHEDQIEELITWNLEVSISSRLKAECVSHVCRTLRKRCRVHLEVDVGMHRTGMRVETAERECAYLRNLEGLEWVGIYSHLATSDRPCDLTCLAHIAAFSALKKEPRLIRHLANSGGVVHYPESHFDMVRPALLIFGYLPQDSPACYQAIAPCFSLKAKISYFKVVHAGCGISYSHTYVTPKQTRIVTVPIGYGDGFRRALSNRGSVLIRGKRFPIRGSICMDQFMVDVGNEEVYVGDEVVLIGKQGDEGISVEEVAGLCGTIPYEILCQFNDRVPRVYIL